MPEVLPEFALWIEEDVALAIHERQLAEHGGLSGVRDAGLLASALGRPQHLDAYGAPDLYELAACYAYGIAKNHPFVDGNKRTALVCCIAFLNLNGYDIEADMVEAYDTFYRLAAGELNEEQFAAWLRERGKKL